MYPEYLKGCMDHAAQERMATTGKDMQKQSIQISQFWEEELKAMPYLTRKSLARLPILIYLYRIQRKTARLCTC